MKNNAPGPTEPGYCSSYVPSTLISYSIYCKGNLLRLPTKKEFTTFKDGDLQVYGSYSSDRINSTDITQSLQGNLARNEKKKKKSFFKVGLLSNTDQKERKKERKIPQ